MAVQTIDLNAESIRVCLRLPEGYKFLPDGTHSVNITSSDERIVAVPTFELPDLSFDYRVPVKAIGQGEATLRIQAMVFFCPVSDESICMFNACDVEQPVEVVKEGGDGVEIFYDIEPMG
jgi:hypothetical protein